MRKFVSLFCLVLILSGCYNRGPITPDAWDLTSQQIDSISFYTTHHYTQNYNFVVTGDSLVLVAQQPEDMSVPDVVSMEIESETGELQKDSVTIRKHERIVVADIKTLPADTIDSVWVKVARDQLTFGWIHENELLEKVSFYPTTLCLLIASSAVLYSSIQLFGPETWRHFYYHPSLNPFALPFWLGVFITSVWAIIIVAIATVDDVTRMLPLGQAILYLIGLAAVCAVCYVVFSITTLYYIGYPLLIAYYYFAFRQVSSHS